MKEKVQKFMNMVMEEVTRNSLKDLMEIYGMNVETDLEIIKDWFYVHDIKIKI